MPPKASVGIDDASTSLSHNVYNQYPFLKILTNRRIEDGFRLINEKGFTIADRILATKKEKGLHDAFDIAFLPSVTEFAALSIARTSNAL